MPVALHLYRFIEDAWAGGLQAWCSGGDEAWILADNAGQRRWLLRKLAESGMAGIRILDADELRDELARLAGGDALPRFPATAAFAVRVAARDTDVARDAGALSEACEALSRAGWHANQLGLDAAVTRRLHRILDREILLPGRFERRLFERLPALPRVCCVGWDAGHWPDIALLDLLAAKAVNFEMFVPSPRLPADGLQREWIEALEQRFGLERVTCPESGFASENESLAARLENSELASRAEARAPILLVGREWPDQVRLVFAQVETWLTENSEPKEPIGIIAPEDSPTALAMAERLVMAGIRVEHPRRVREPAPALLIVEQVARYHSSGQDVMELLEMARLLWLHGPEKWKPLDPGRVQDVLDRAFQSAQSRNARILARAMPWRKDFEWTAVYELVEVLGRWDADLAWPALWKKWESILASLGLPVDSLRPPPGGLFGNEPVPARGFVEWVAAEVAAIRSSSAPPDYAALAPVVVTTFADAARQTWSRLIFVDSNEHVWPAAIPENPFLPDSARVRLNGNRHEAGRLLTTHDLRALEQARFLDLVEHCRRPITFAGVLLEQTDAGDRAQPNEWVLRALIETAEDSFPPELWEASAQTIAPEIPPELETDERAHLELVHASRQNATMPFDRYQFNFNETRLQPDAWSATDLDEAVLCPATFALRTLLGAESIAGWTPLRGEGAAVGNRAHRWLGRILGLGDHLSPPSPAAGDEAMLARELAAARRELEEWYRAEGLPLPIWWETCLRKTEWATRRCLREVRAWLEGDFCAMEQTLAVLVQTTGGSLPLKGRIDILISDRAEIEGARLRLFDFKTGRSQAPTIASLERGYGAQFAAYYLMARDAGAADAVIGIIKPEEQARDVFSTADEADLRAWFSVLAGLRRTLRFGRRGPLVSEYGVCETLPLATVPIDPAILEQKAALVLLAS